MVQLRKEKSQSFISLKILATPVSRTWFLPLFIPHGNFRNNSSATNLRKLLLTRSNPPTSSHLELAPHGLGPHGNLHLQDYPIYCLVSAPSPDSTLSRDRQRLTPHWYSVFIQWINEGGKLPDSYQIPVFNPCTQAAGSPLGTRTGTWKYVPYLRVTQWGLQVRHQARRQSSQFGICRHTQSINM